MNRNDELLEQYEEIFFTLLMNRYAEEKGKDLREENAELMKDPSKALPEDLEKKCLKTIHKSLSKENARNFKHITLKILNKVAIAACVAMILFVTAFASSTKLQAESINFLVERFNSHTSFSFSGTYTVAAAPRVFVEWLPDGLDLAEQEQNLFRTRLTYLGPNDEKCIIYVSSEESALVIDTEQSQKSEIVLNGQPAILIASNDQTYTLTWELKSPRGIVNITSNNISEEDLIHIAENIDVA